jgi:hypothetical protein
MQKIQLLSHNAYHPRQGGPDGIGSWDASFLVELIGQPPTDAMGLALHPRDAMTHRKEERPIRQIPRQQPESVIAQIQHDPSLRQLRCELCARNDCDRTPMGRLQDRSDRRTQQRLESAFREQTVPGRIEHQLIACTDILDHRTPG